MFLRLSIHIKYVSRCLDVMYTLKILYLYKGSWREGWPVQISAHLHPVDASAHSKESIQCVLYGRNDLGVWTQAQIFREDCLDNMFHLGLVSLVKINIFIHLSVLIPDYLSIMQCQQCMRLIKKSLLELWLLVESIYP